MGSCLATNPDTYVDTYYAFIASDDVEGLCQAIRQANGNTSIVYPIYLDTGTYTVNTTLVVYGKVKIFGRGIDVTVINQDTLNTIQGIMTINGSAMLEVHNVTFKNGNATNAAAGATSGGAIKQWNGSLKVYDSKFDTNIASERGGAIRIYAGTAQIERTIFINNRSTGTNGNGGAIATNSGISNLSTSCTRFESNHAASLGGAIYAENGANINIKGNQLGKENSFITNNNAPTDPATSKQIHDAGLTTLDATQNWWNPLPPSSPLDANSTVNISSAVSNDPTLIYASADYYNANSPCRMLPARTVDRNAVELQLFGQVLGLPIPFNQFPADLTGLTGFYINGYGPNSFAADSWQQNYSGTSGIHTGMDYSANILTWNHKSVVALCNGVVVAGRNADGGSTAPGQGLGVSLRCFADEPRDPDSDSWRNMSNIVLTYNHLSSRSVSVGQVIFANQILGQTGAVNVTPDHLHLEAFINDAGGGTGWRGNNGIRINPLLLYRKDISDFQVYRTLKPYYPILFSWNGQFDPNVYDILAGELDRWSNEGDIIGNGNIFWQAQLTGVLNWGVEWPSGLLANPQQSPNYIGLVDYLFQNAGYSRNGSAYIGPNCTTVPADANVQQLINNNPSLSCSIP
ncbi:MAG: M23 family metallopeptidase [Chloroflexi bacterium]|nr:M23 family metallopeptidase [Chloroflexota bacterium]MCC6893209.1 hypothetical protein [Anaerolineae bacterium]